MAEKYYVLSEDDRAVLKEWIRWEMSRVINSPNRVMNLENQQTAPEVYMARSGSAISAITEATVGTGTSYTPNSASCDVYRIDLETGKLEQIDDLTRDVYNLSDEEIPAGWIIIHRDKWGRWVAGLTSSGSSSDTSGDGVTGGCNCFDCASDAQSPITTCVNCPTGCPAQRIIPFGVSEDWPTLFGDQIVRYDADCDWKSDPILIDPGTGSGSAGGGELQWVLTIAGVDTELNLVLYSGVDPTGLV